MYNRWWTYCRIIIWECHKCNYKDILNKTSMHSHAQESLSALTIKTGHFNMHIFTKDQKWKIFWFQNAMHLMLHILHFCFYLIFSLPIISHLHIFVRKWLPSLFPNLATTIKDSWLVSCRLVHIRLLPVFSICTSHPYYGLTSTLPATQLKMWAALTKMLLDVQRSDVIEMHE